MSRTAPHTDVSLLTPQLTVEPSRVTAFGQSGQNTQIQTNSIQSTIYGSEATGTSDYRPWLVQH